MVIYNHSISHFFLSRHVNSITKPDDTPHLLENEDIADYDDTDYRRPSDADSEATIPRDHALEQSDRIRTRYLAQILPNTNIPERQ